MWDCGYFELTESSRVYSTEICPEKKFGLSDMWGGGPYKKWASVFILVVLEKFKIHPIWLKSLPNNVSRF